MMRIKNYEMNHELKTWQPYFHEVMYGHKNFDIRFNDRDFKIGDTVQLKEFNPESNSYTGATLTRRITYVLHGTPENEKFGLKKGFCILSLSI